MGQLLMNEGGPTCELYRNPVHPPNAALFKLRHYRQSRRLRGGGICGAAGGKVGGELFRVAIIAKTEIFHRG
jgi:hypothetical protein